MADRRNRSAEQLLSDLHQERLEQALSDFNADKTRMAVGRLLEEYVDDGGQSYFDGAKKDATLYFADDDYIKEVNKEEPVDKLENDFEEKPKQAKKGGFFAGALSKLAEKLKETEEPEDYEDEFGQSDDDDDDDVTLLPKEDAEDDQVSLIDGTNKGFDMPDLNEMKVSVDVEEEEAVPPVKPSIFDTAKLQNLDLTDIENRLEKAHIKPAVMEFADPDDVLREILGETAKEDMPKEDTKTPEKPSKKEIKKNTKKSESLDDISVEDMGLGSIVEELSKEENKSEIEKAEIEAPQEESLETAETPNEEKTETAEAPQEETAEIPMDETTITITEIPEETVRENEETAETAPEEDYAAKFTEKANNKNTYVAEKTVILDKPLISAEDIEEVSQQEAESSQPLSQEDDNMTKEEEVLNAITEAEEEVIPSRRRRFVEEKKKGKRKPVQEEIAEDQSEEDEYQDDFEDTEEEDKPKKGLFGLFKKKKKDEDEDFDDEDEDEIDEDESEEESDIDEDFDDEDEDEDFDDEDEEEDDDFDDFDDDYGKGSSVGKFFIGALIVILVVAVTALAAICYSYKSQLDSAKAQLDQLKGGSTEETTLVEVTTVLEATTEAVSATEAETSAPVSTGNNNTQAVQIVDGDGTASSATGATASGTSYTIKSGDTGEKICKSVYGEYTPENWSKILAANNMNENSTYHPGQELIIP